MPTSPSKNRRAAVAVSRAGWTIVLVGVAFAMLGPRLFDGFVKGLFVGAGVALIVVGVGVVSARRRSGSEGSWLPSSDE